MRFPRNNSEAMTFRDIVNKLKAYDDKVNRMWGVYTPAERIEAKEHRKSELVRHRPTLINGMRAELETAQSSVKRAEQLMKVAQKKEINSWDSTRLNSEMDIATKRISQAVKSDDPTKAIQALVQEADNSGDRYKIRALGEMIQGEGKNLPEFQNRADIQWAGLQQGKKLKELMTSPEMIEVEKLASTAYDQYGAKIEELAQISKLIGEGDPLDAHATNDLSKAMRKFQNRGKPIESRKPEIEKIFHAGSKGIRD